MQRSFDFLADYAEHELRINNNVCLLHLGRLAETINEILSNKSSIQMKMPDVSLQKGIIDKGICLWFMSIDGTSRFAFLADMFPENEPCPPLACLAEYGTEAEANLHNNTRYCLLCLGDIEEAITEMFLERSGIEISDSIEQHRRINKLLKPLGSENREKIRVLHELRQARNDAVHGHYNSEDAAKKLLEEALELCEWVFLRIVSPGDFVKVKITSITEDGLNVNVGRICGKVPLDEISPEKRGTYCEGESRVFRVTEKSPEGLSLRLGQAQTDPWTNMKRRYQRYEVGQVLSVTVKSISENEGAVVRFGENGDTEARIPKSEFGSMATPPKSKDAMRTGDKLKAKILEIDPEHYPYMLMSVEELERKQEVSRPDKWERVSEPSAKSAMSDKEFIAFCREATHEQIVAALDAGANPNARSKFGITPLMEAAHMNDDLGAIKELIDAGAKVNAKNDKGNTALMFAAMRNGPEVVRLLCEKGAEIEPANNQGRDALSYAMANQKLKNDEGIIQLLTSEDAEMGARVVSPKPQSKGMNDRQFIALCKRGRGEAILRAIDGGANVNARDSSQGTTVLIYVSMFDIPEVVEAMLERGADVNAVNKKGMTALLNAVMNSRYRNIEILLDSGAEVRVTKKNGKTLLEYAREKLSNKKGESCLRRIESELGMMEREKLGVAPSDGLPAEARDEIFGDGLAIESRDEILDGELNATSCDETPGDDLPDTSRDEILDGELNATSCTETPDGELNASSCDETPDGVLPASSSTETLGDVLPAASHDESSSDSLPATSRNEPLGGELPDTSRNETPDGVLNATQHEEISGDGLPATSSTEIPGDGLPAMSRTEIPGDGLNAMSRTEILGDGLNAISREETPDDELPATSSTETPGDSLPATSRTEPSGESLPATSRYETTDQNETLSHQQHQEALRALKLTFQRDILKISRSGSLDDLSQALASGVSVNVKNKSLATPLMFAAKSNSSDVIDLLVQAGADLNSQDSNGNTPLIYASAYNTDDVVESLLNAGADTSLKNLDGYSALDYAKINYRLIDTNALLRLRE